LGQYDKARRRSSRKIDVHLKALRSSGSSLNERFRRSKRRRARKSPSRRFLAPRMLLLIGVLCGIYLLASAVFGGDETSITVVVEEGDTLASVADKLEEAGVISSPTFFGLKARIEGAATESTSSGPVKTLIRSSRPSPPAIPSRPFRSLSLKV
jgi:hypothetical protein